MEGFYCDSCGEFIDTPNVDVEGNYVCPICLDNVRYRDTDREREDGEAEIRHEQNFGTTDRS